MKLNTMAGTTIVPTLARLVLALAFIGAGWNKLTVDANFAGDDRLQLEQLGVDCPVYTGETASRGGRAITLVSDEAAGSGATAPGTVPPAIVLQDQPAADAPPPAGSGSAKSLYQVTLFCHRAGWPQPVLLGWLAAGTELVGGALILVGFLTRIWGLGLAIAMAAAVYLDSLGYGLPAGSVAPVSTFNPIVLAQDLPVFYQLFCRLGLFVLAFGLALTGAGPFSVDRVLFGRRGRGEIIYDDGSS